MKLRFDIKPMGAVRMTGRGKFVKPNAQKYLAYKDQIGYAAKKQSKLEMPLHTAVGIPNITFYMPIPKDGRVGYKDENGKRRTRKVKPGDYHTVKPDWDNLAKGLTDSFKDIIWQDDSLVCDVGRVRKIYSETPGIEVEIVELF